jgi:pimeloyl-ACP methyl ester carboxylesterase
MRTQFDTRSRITSVTAPVAVVIGTADDVVPNEQSRAVFDAAPHPELLVPIPGYGHVDIDEITPPPIADTLAAFITLHAPC